MSDAPEPAQEAADGPKGPFRITGSDGSERAPFADLELARAAKENLVKVHDGEGHDFVIWDATGEAVD